MAGMNATEVPLALLLGDCIADLDGVMAALSGATALIFSNDLGSRVSEVIQAARIVRDQLGRLQALRSRIDDFDRSTALEGFVDMPLGSFPQAPRGQG
jgi:hypothetical protein